MVVPLNIYLLVECVILSLGLSAVVALAGSALSMKTLGDSEKLSPFECGFSSKVNHRSLFSIQFFLICLIFVIFDVELVILFPLISSFPEIASLSEILLFVSVLFLLSIGLMWEWASGMLEWMM